MGKSFLDLKPDSWLVPICTLSPVGSPRRRTIRVSSPNVYNAQSQVRRQAQFARSVPQFLYVSHAIKLGSETCAFGCCSLRGWTGLDEWIKEKQESIMAMKEKSKEESKAKERKEDKREDKKKEEKREDKRMGKKHK